MAQREVVAFNETTKTFTAPQSGDSYSLPRDVAITGLLTVAGSIHATVDIGSPSVTTPLIILGGIGKIHWPSSVPGAAGQVLQTGQINLAGMDGVTVVHSIGNINYAVKTMPKGLTGAVVGEITYIKSSNTVTIYNTGVGSQYHSSVSADIEISAL